MIRHKSRPDERRVRALWLTAGLLLAGAFLFAADREADRQKQLRIDAFRGRVADLARISEAIIEERLRQYDDTLLVLRNQYAAAPERFGGCIELLRSGPLADRETLVVLVDRTGSLAFTDAATAKPGLYLGDRAYFRYFADGGQDRLYIDEPTFGRVTRRFAIPLARPIYDGQRAFLGVLALSVRQDSLANFGSRLQLSGDTTVTVVTHGGTVAGRSRDLAKMQGTAIPPDLLAPMLTGTEGVFSGRLIPDGDEQTIAYRHVPDTPLIVFVAVSPGAVLRDASRQRRVLIWGAVALSCIIMALIAVCLRSRKAAAQLAETLRTSKTLEYETLTRTTLDGFLIVGDAGRFLDTNDTLCTLLGRTREELLQLSIADVEAQETPAQIAARISRVTMSGGDRFQSRWRRKDGALIDVEISAQHVPEKGGRCFAFVRDITERKTATEKLLKERDFSRAVLDTLPGIVYLFDAEGRFLRWNRSLERVSGYTAEEIGRMSPLDFFVEPDRTAVRRKIGETFEKGSAEIEAEFTVKSGRHEPYFLTGRLIDVEGQACLIGMGVDITERKRLAREKSQLEDQLRQAHKVEAIGRLAGGVAHDFNNMTAIVLGYGELLLSRLGPADPSRAWVEQIVEAGRRSAALTRQLLAFSRKQVLLPVVLDLNELLRNLEKMLGRLIGEDITLIFDLADDLGRVTVDPGQIEQVVMNLAINARDAMPQGGRLTIETANAELDETYAREHAEVVPGDYVLLALTDTGCGMDKTHLVRLFEPFFTTKEMGKGTGLGLATTYGIVKQSGGYIWAYSEPGRGATFKIYLPRTKAQPAAPASDHAREAPGGRGEVILLVEDEAALREMGEVILSQLGYRVCTAGNGPEAMALVAATGQKPDLVITDVIMPLMSGAELAQRLRKNWPELKVLFMSGYPDEAITSHGVLGPGISFIQKPFSKPALARKVREVLGEAGAGGEIRG